jgi:hypothetical protein
MTVTVKTAADGQESTTNQGKASIRDPTGRTAGIV